MREWSAIVEDLQVNWIVYVSMPFIAGAIGYLTKLAAIKMMFRPQKFRGIGKLGWQGIIPRRAPQMVEVLCQTLTGRLISAGDIVDRVDSRELARRIERPLRKEVARIVPIVAEEYQPALWHVLPGPARDMVVQRAQEIAGRADPQVRQTAAQEHRRRLRPPGDGHCRVPGGPRHPRADVPRRRSA